MSSAGDVQALVTDPRLVEERRGQIVRAAVKLFSEQGYYTTTIQQIAREAGVSTGLIYQYFRDKDDILFLTLKLVLDTYEHDIPPQLEGVDNPVERLCMAIWTYCRIVDGLLDATVLAYRSTKSLRADRRALVKDAEIRTNSLIEACLSDSIKAGLMAKVNTYLLAYQMVTFAHSWALKNWSLGERYALSNYVSEGIKLLVEPFLTVKGQRVLEEMRKRTHSFGALEARRPASKKAPAKKPEMKSRKKQS